MIILITLIKKLKQGILSNPILAGNNRTRK